MWFTNVLMKYFTTIGMPRNENYPDEYRRMKRNDPTTTEMTRQDSLSWEDIRIFRDKWPGILMVKGINRPDDAVKAMEYGVDGIVVSNHGGRNMDSVVASIDVLPDIAEAVGERGTVILDSGVRRGSDIAKALALGAKAVLTGRSTLYGTAVGGEAGAFKAISLIRNELDKTMAYTGCRSVDEVTTDIFFGGRAGQPAARHGDGHGVMAALDRCLNVYDLRAAAKRRLPKGVFEFVDRATEDHLAVANNRTAFERIKLLHRALVDVSGRSVATTLFGKPASLPMAIAPTGAAGLCWHEGELELAKAAAKAKIPLTLSTASMTSMEKIAQHGGPASAGGSGSSSMSGSSASCRTS